MKLLLKPCRGISLVLRDQSQPLYRLPADQEPAVVEVYQGFADEPLGTAELIGTVAPGQTLVRNYIPEVDRDLRFYLVSRGVDGARDTSLLSESVSTVFSLRRENEEPVIGQIGAAENLLAVVGVNNFTRFARLRKVETAGDVDFTTDVQTEIYDGADFVAKELPRYINVNRPSGAGTLTKFVRVSHSSGAAYGPTSNVLEVTFANSGGAGGSTGSFDPIPRLDYELLP
jgi:hypothetical protein